MSKTAKVFISLIIAAVMMIPSGVRLPAPLAEKTAKADESAAAAEATAVSYSSLPKKLMNGDFEDPAIAATDFESGTSIGGPWYVAEVDTLETMAKNRGAEGFYWKTTATDKKIELVSNVNSDSSNSYNVEPYSGTQFAELVAEEQASIYQDLYTPTAGVVMKWSLVHSGRRGNDTMALFIGPRQSDLTKTSAAGKDIFMWMAELIKGVSSISDWASAAVGIGEHTIYSKKDIDLNEVTANNYKDYFSITKTDKIDQEWKCWIITGAKGAWESYQGEYSVPDGQTGTTFAFTALTGQSNYPLVSGQINEGNLIDDLDFEISYPLRAATTAGGKGTVSAVETTADETTGEETEGMVKHAFDHSTDFIKDYEEGTEVTVTATPEEGYQFLGAYINGTFNGADEYFNKESSSYSCTITMDDSKYVQLIFSKADTIIYDPNGGTYRGSAENTEIKMGVEADPDASPPVYNVWDNTKNNEPGDVSAYADAIPPNDVTRFIGWYVGRITYGNETTGGLIKSAHTVEVVTEAPADSTETETTEGAESNAESTDSETSNTDNMLKLSYTWAVGQNSTGEQKFPMPSGLVFIAQWEYDQRAIAQTKMTSETSYTDGDGGGTVRIKTLKGTAIAGRAITTEYDEGDPVTYDGELTDNIPNGGNQSYGWGRLKDIVTMEAEPKSGYRFRGWYDAEGNQLSQSVLYSYSVSDAATVYARFSETHLPYVSFVLQDDSGVSAASDDDGAADSVLNSTHIKKYTMNGSERVCTNINASGLGGADYYGNTISTGFLTHQTFASGQEYNYTQWCIHIPMADIAEYPTYIKLAKDYSNESGDVTIGSFRIEHTPVLTDGNGVGPNKGYIYKVKGLTEDVEIRLFNDLPTKITGDSGLDLTYSIVIDNLYIPNSYATVDLMSLKKEILFDSVDITAADNQDAIHALNLNEYLSSEHNEYNKR